MSKRFLIKLGAPILALSLVAACGTDNDQDPIDDEAPLAPEDEAPLNQDDDNNNLNPAEDDGLMDDDGINGNGDDTNGDMGTIDGNNTNGTNGTDGTVNDDEGELINGGNNDNNNE